LVALDESGETFRYHRLRRQVLHAAPRARDRDREPLLHTRAPEHFEQTGDPPRATRHFLAARQIHRALDLMQDRVITDFLQNPTPPGTLDLSMVTPTTLTNTPDQLLAVAADLLLRGDITRARDYLDHLAEATELAPLEPRLARRLAAMQCFYYGLTGQLTKAEGMAARARAIQEQTQPTDEWDAAVPLVMLRLYASLGDVK